MVKILFIQLLEVACSSPFFLHCFFLSYHPKDCIASFKDLKMVCEKNTKVITRCNEDHNMIRQFIFVDVAGTSRLPFALRSSFLHNLQMHYITWVMQRFVKCILKS